MEYWKKNLAILMVCQFLVAGSMSMIMPFLPLYLYDLGLRDPNEIQFWSGVIFGVSFFSSFLVSPLWGNLADRYGRKLMVFRSGFGMSIVIFLTGLVTNHWQLFFLRMINGMISGFIPSSIALMATNTPREKVGYALGLLQSGAVAGSILGPFIGGILAEITDFRQIFYLTGTCLAIATFITLMFVKEEFTPQVREQKASFWKEGSFILRQPTLLVLFVSGVLLQFATTGPQPLMSVFVVELGAPGGYVAFFAGLVAAFTGLANMLASPLLGRWGDQYGARKVLFWSLICAALIFIPHYFVEDIWQFLAMRFLLGLSLGGLLPSLNALIRKLSPAGKESTVYGFHNSAVSLGNMLGPVTYGVVSGWVGIRGVFLITAGLLFFNAGWLYFNSKKEANLELKRTAS